MYRCKICQDVSEPREPRILHIVQRTVPNHSYNAKSPTRQEIAEEIPVCRVCSDYIQTTSLKFVIQKRGCKLQRTTETPLVRPSINEKVSIGKAAKVTTGTLKILGQQIPVKVASRSLEDSSVSQPPSKESLKRESSTPGQRKQIKMGDVPLCDICGASAVGGQVTAHTILCRGHMKRLLEA